MIIEKNNKKYNNNKFNNDKNSQFNLIYHMHMAVA